MVVLTWHAPKVYRLTWRGRLPAWFGLMRFDGRLCGAYVRLGEKAWGLTRLPGDD